MAINIDLSEIIGWERVAMAVVIFLVYQIGMTGGHAARSAIDRWLGRGQGPQNIELQHQPQQQHHQQQQLGPQEQQQQPEPEDQQQPEPEDQQQQPEPEDQQHQPEPE